MIEIWEVCESNQNYAILKYQSKCKKIPMTAPIIKDLNNVYLTILVKFWMYTYKSWQSEFNDFYRNLIMI